MRVGLGLGVSLHRPFVSGGAPTPTPTPAPTFNTQPSISDDGSPAVGETLTGNDGTISNGSVSTRQWLLNGSAISGATGASYVPVAIGDHAYRVTATGPGGSTTATSVVRTVAPAPAPPAQMQKLVTMGDSITSQKSITLPSYARRAPPDLGLVMGSTSIIEFNGVDFAEGAAAAFSRGMGVPSDPDNPISSNKIWSQKLKVVQANPDTITLLIGANDLTNDFPGSTEVEKVTYYINGIFQFVAWLRANGLSPVRFGLGLLTPKGPGALYYQSFNTRRVIFNSLARANVGGPIDFIEPFGEHPDYGTDASANTFFYDSEGVHPISPAIWPMTRQHIAVLRPLRDQVIPGSGPADFAFLPQNNLAPGTEVIHQAMITGIGMGAKKPVSVVGPGLIARGTGAFGTTPFDVMDGDVVCVKETSPAGVAATTSSTVTVGSKSASTTTRTAPASMVQIVSNGTRHFGSAGASSPITCTFPAGRPIIFLTNVYDTNGAGTVTINGVQATRVGRAKILNSNNANMAVWVGPPGQNLAAGNYNVVLAGGYVADSYVYPGATTSTSDATTWAWTKVDNLYQTAANEQWWEAPNALECVSGGIIALFALAHTDTVMVDGTLERNFPFNMNGQDDAFTYQQVWWFTSRKSRIPACRFNMAGGEYAGFIAVSIKP